MLIRTAADKGKPGGGRIRLARPLRSVRGRLVLLLLTFALAPLILVGFLAGDYGRRLLQESIGSSLQKVARAVVSSVDQGIEQRRRSVAEMAAFPAIQQAALQGRSPETRQDRPSRDGRVERWEEDPAAGSELSRLLVRLTGSSPDLAQVLVTDRDGWIVAASSAPMDLYQGDESWWFRARSGSCERSYVDGLQFDSSVGDQVAAITVPVCREERVVGVLKAKVALDRILHMVSDLDLEGVARVWIINNNGATVAALEESGRAEVSAEAARPASEVARSIVGSVSGFLEASMAEVPSVVGYASSTGAGEFRGLGWIVLVVEPVASAYRPVARFQAVLVLLSAFLFFLVVVAGVRAAGKLTLPVRRATAMAQAVARGSLGQSLEQSGQEELDRLADGLNGMTANLRRMVGSIRGAAGQVDAATRVLTATSGRVLDGSRQQIERVDETGRLMQEAGGSLEEVFSSLGGMVAATDDCSASIHEMDANISEIVRSTETLATSTESTLAAVEQMVRSIKQVDGGVDSLREVVATTAASVSGMETAIQRVEGAAARTEDATTHAARLAEAGQQAVERTVAGMGEIESAASRTARVIERLAGQVTKIDGILGIIGEVTDQTNLLALNAAILAAQAGEHGGGFAVVAAEIKDLAERTARSTREITDLIRSVQEGAREAGEAMADGLRHVNDGVSRSREAGDALEEILAGTQQSSRTTRDIVEAAAEHASQSRAMTGAIDRIGEVVAGIASVTQEQSQGCASILKASEQTRDQTSLVRRAILDQQEGSRRISASVERVTHTAKAIERSGERQRQLSRGVTQAIERIGSVSHEHVRTLNEVHEAIQSLNARAHELRSQIAFFREGDAMPVDDGPPPDSRLSGEDGTAAPGTAPVDPPAW